MTNEEKQIEEIKQLARDIFERGTALDGIDFVHAAVNGADDDPESHFMRIARHLYVTKGYRKASDVAREIFEGVDSTIDLICAMTGLDIKVFGKYAELKKKYTEVTVGEE